MRTIIAHAHIFKNAGTTLDWSLQRSFGESFLDHRNDQKMIEGGGEYLQKLLEDAPELQAISSHHMPANLPQVLNRQIVALYMLRHPLERIASVYEFEKQQRATTSGAKAAKKYDFQEYVAWRMQMGVSRTIRNHQTIYVAGKFHVGNTRPLSFAVLQLAIERLKRLPLVGVVDRYDEFMVVIEDYFSDLMPQLDLAYKRQNESLSKRPATTSERVAGVLHGLGAMQQQVIDENAMDLALYQLAHRRLDEAAAKISGFEEKLGVFRSRCGDL